MSGLANGMAIGLPLIVLLYSVFMSRFGRPLPDRLVAVLIFLTVILYRIPYILTNIPLDLDEDIILTFGLNLTRNPVIFDTIEPNTMGVIHAYVAMCVVWFKPVADIAYSALHLLSALIHSLCLWLLYLAQKSFFSYRAAIAGTALGLLCLVFNTDLAFASYHNEIESILLLSWAIYLLSRLSKNSEANLSLLAILGLVLGCIPYAKLQGVPIALLLAIFAFYIIQTGQRQNQRKLAMSLTLILSGLAPTAILFSVLGLNHLLDDFFFYYVKANLVSVLSWSLFEQLRGFIAIMPTQFRCAMCLPLLLFAISFRTIIRKPIFYAISLLFLVGYYSITKSGLYYTHYYSYMLFFITLGSGLGMNCLVSYSSQKLFQSIVVVSCVIALSSSWLLRTKVLSEVKLERIQQSEAAREILKLSQSSDDRLAVWGWYPRLNVETGLPSATKENHSFYTSFSSYRDEFERRYVADLERFQPFVFVDSNVMRVGSFVPFQEKPLLAHYLAKNYIFYRSVPGSAYNNHEPVDIYVKVKRDGNR